MGGASACRDSIIHTLSVGGRGCPTVKVGPKEMKGSEREE